MKIKLNLN